jgi:endothelin-converting enzyme
LLTILDDGNGGNDELDFIQHDQQKKLTVKEGMWPPWPWPPWDGDDDGGGNGGGGEDEPPKRRDMHGLAKKVIEFESKIAKASLDL